MNPFGYLNYKGQLSDQTGRQMGPNVFGEMFTVVEQSYDPNTKTTRLALYLSRMIKDENAST